jgi:hypothetical protein
MTNDYTKSNGVDTKQESPLAVKLGALHDIHKFFFFKKKKKKKKKKKGYIKEIDDKSTGLMWQDHVLLI